MHVSVLCLEISNIYSIFNACFNSIDRNASNDGKGKTLCFLVSKILVMQLSDMKTTTVEKEIS